MTLVCSVHDELCCSPTIVRDGYSPRSERKYAKTVLVFVWPDKEERDWMLEMLRGRRARVTN